MNKLEQAARQALGALVRAEAMYGQPNADIQTALREALAEQAEQEPVAYAGMIDGSVCAVYTQWPVSHYHKIKPLYAAPVRTKDLTDVDLWKLWEKSDSNIAFARAVIAADREKNK